MNVTYDSRNRVVRRVSPTGTLNLTYSGWNLIEERNGGGELVQTYLHGAGVDEMLVKVSSSGPAYYHHDGLGSTVALTGENGELLESYRYDAFGAASVYDSSGSALPASPRGNRFLFTGREHLSSVSLYDYRNRVYSASLGRFLQTDPIRFEAGDVNLYRYVANNPVNLTDPLGLFAPAPALPAIAGGAATGIGAAGAAAGVAAAGVGVGIGIGINNIPIGDGRNVGDALADFVYDNIVEPIQNSGRNERGQRNYLNDEAAQRARQNGTDVCTELAKMAAEEKSRGRDSCSKTLNDIKQAQKAAGCRHSNK